MANLNDVRDYIQHSHPNTIHQNSSKYNVKHDARFLDGLIDNLWYAYNEESFQLPYANKTLTPAYLKDKTYDLMMCWNLALLLDIDASNFIVKNKKTDTILAINSLTNFNTDNTLVIFYDKNNSNHDSLIMKFLKSFRNALAHGGFNKLQLYGKTNTVYLAAENYDDCITKGTQLVIRLIKKVHGEDCEYTHNVPSAINDILSHNYTSLLDLFERNLTLSGNSIEGKVDMSYSIDGIDYNVILYYLHKIELDKRLFYIENGKADEIKKIIRDVIFELISRNESITNIFFYLANGQHNISIKGIEEECVSKIIKTNDKTEIANYILENSFSLNIINKMECFNL